MTGFDWFTANSSCLASRLVRFWSRPTEKVFQSLGRV
jgi:hypothetical protein